MAKSRSQESPTATARSLSEVFAATAVLSSAMKGRGSTSRLPDPTDPANLERQQRGVRLIQMFMDEVTFNGLATRSRCKRATQTPRLPKTWQVTMREGETVFALMQPTHCPHRLRPDGHRLTAMRPTRPAPRTRPIRLRPNGTNLVLTKTSPPRRNVFWNTRCERVAAGRTANVLDELRAEVWEDGLSARRFELWPARSHQPCSPKPPSLTRAASLRALPADEGEVTIASPGALGEKRGSVGRLFLELRPAL